MKCSTLLKNVREYWPEELVINEADPDQLNKLYWAFEAKFEGTEQHWLILSGWAFHQAIDLFIESEKEKGKKSIPLHELPMQLFNKQMLFNLKEECWEKERLEYLQE